MALLRGLAAILAAIRDLASNGLITRTSATTVAARTIIGTADQISVADGDGVAGNPTLSTPQDIDTAAEAQFAKLGLGVAPGFDFHLQPGAASGATPAGSYDDGVIDLAGTGGVSILAPDASNVNFALGNVADSTSAVMQWEGATSRLNFGSYATGGEVRLRSGAGVLAAVIGSDQRISIGSTTFGGRLKVDQSSGIAGIAALQLLQSDVDQEFIAIRGTAAAGNLARSIVDAGDVSVATIAGYAMVNVTDDGNQITDQDYFLPLYTLT